MTEYTSINRWSALFAWATMMLIVWALFVPERLSTGTFSMLVGGGAMMLFAAATLWRAQRPASSLGQMRAMADAADAADAQIPKPQIDRQ